MKQPVKRVLLKKCAIINDLLLCSVHFSHHICMICQLVVEFQLDLFSMRRLCLLSSVSSVPSFFLVTTREKFVVVSRYIVHKKHSQKSYCLNFYSVEDKEIRLETWYLAISSIPSFSVAESFIVSIVLPCVETAHA